jgi:hypothetical protein
MKCIDDVSQKTAARTPTPLLSVIFSIILEIRNALIRNNRKIIVRNPTGFRPNIQFEKKK